MENIKQINIKNGTYYFNDMIIIEDFDSNLLKIDKKKTYKNIGIYNIGYITMKKLDDYENINSVNPLYLIIGKVEGYIKENNGNKYLVFTSTDGNKEVLAKFIKLWDEIKYLIETVNGGKKGEYEKDFMKIRFELDDNLPLNKILKLHMLTVIIRETATEIEPRTTKFVNEHSTIWPMAKWLSAHLRTKWF